MNKQTCISCNTQYSQTQKTKTCSIMEREHIPIKNYPSTCIPCIIRELHQEKQQYHSNLLEATNALQTARQAYQQASMHHQAISSKYTKYDQQASYLQFFLEQSKQASKRTKSSTKASAKAKQDQAKQDQAKQADIIATLLASLTPEQQALIALKAKSL